MIIAYFAKVSETVDIPKYSFLCSVT